MSNRRSFLRILGMAPIAAPVAAKEAAVAMGLSNGVGATVVGSVFANVGNPSGPVPGFDKAWLVNRLSEFNSAAKRDEIKRQFSGGMVLDADIAAMRSLSPSVARQMQMDRQIDRHIANETHWIRQELSRATGGIL